MKKTTPLKSLALLISCLFISSIGFGQTKLAEITFETPGGYSTDITEFTDQAISTGRDYFIRTDGSTINGVVFSNIQGSYYFAAQDIDGEGATLPVRFLMNNVNISGYTSLEFRVHLAEDDDGANEDWDDSDFVHFNYDIDNTGTFSDLLWIENDGTVFNTEPLIDTDYDGTGDGTAITNTFTQFTQNIAGTGSLLDIEIVFNLDSGDEDIAIDNIEIWGTLIPCGAPVTWDGSAWDNITGPDITTEAIINGNYNTSTANFSACSLTVNNNSTLTINDNTYIEIQNDITVDIGSSIDVQPYGSLVQNNDSGVVTNNGSMTVDKITAPMDAWYEYTYWSSPVSGETISNAITGSHPNRRFIFNGQTFLDHCAETGNNNILVCDDGFGNGVQDDIDDNGDDWQSISGVMQSGVGYATTLTQFAYNVAPGASNKTFRFTFTGDFHNGIYNIPIYRNDSETNDNNWNFIGNPYPSAIDVDLFLAANTVIDETNTFPPRPIVGAIYLWSQNTPPSAIANGNQQLNFSDSDFAIINGVTQIAGGDGISPTNRKIPSGQAFFVSYSDSATPVSTSINGDGHTIAQGNITFNNSMRTTGATDNSLFFKGSSSKKNSKTQANKLWLNLISDNGIFNQTAIAYVDSATDADDGSYFDTQKNAAIVTGAILYTNIEDSNKKFGIQGKAANSLDINETIQLGFKSNVGVATLFKLSIDHLQGDFLTNNTVYLKDNLLNKLHDLSASDYTFTSEVGEFNDRFEIVFNANSLSIDNIAVDKNSLSIIELDNDHVQFKTSNSLNIKTVAVFDLLGRQLYNFEGQKSSETYRLSNLNSSIYIAKVTLSNGAIITKKAVKK
ncbi:T9SS type A sorting domain-containing protein [Flavivirga amylovorans]|uniref:T9SS type A sorting domain-containing protein n=1 Tax=Flavivirga amylovorans TaxID=870486 RepID=A0ABT8X350_9FLAO|nr:T9SS type A sorting domain-containing protein [Flavivirga amylovorans]MDO5988132.1 T9SS type A sorting domain-containing protein [Flavivirga amylovorans]